MIVNMEKRVKKSNLRSGVTVVIPNYNGRELVDGCLASLYKQKVRPNEIIVVDNGSKDGSKKLIERKYPSVQIISLPKNQGFSKAVNIGIKNADFDKLFILNNDTKVKSSCLKFLLEHLRKRPRLCVVVPKILLSNGKIDSVGSFINELGQAFHRREKEIGKTQFEEVFLVTGAAVLCRKNIFEKVGFFEEKFFAYGEDVDWSFRAQLKGCKFLCDHRAIVYHRHKGTSSKEPRHLEYLQFRNAYLFILRCLPFITILKRGRLFGIVFTNINTFFHLLFRGFLLEAARAELWLVFNLPWIFRERIKIQKERVVSLSYIENNLKPKEIRLRWRMND